MGIFNRFKSKKEEMEKSEKELVAIKAEERKEKSVVKKPKAEKPKKNIKTRKIVKKEENIAYETLLEPLVSEKSTVLGQFNKYVFNVHTKASKFQIKSAVESYYGVGVTKVNVIKIHPKRRIHGRTVGWKQGFKKAVVTLQQGDTIGVAESV